MSGKIIDNKRLVAEKTTTAYQQEFRSLFMALNSNPDYNEWMDLYKKLVYWELEMEKSDSPEMREVFQTQKQEANTEFFKFISKNYTRWVNPKAEEGPIMSHTLFRYKVLPHVEKGTPTFFILLDNLRIDQWKAIQPIFAESFRVTEEDSFYSILPTATQYCRNAIFAGLMPIDIEKQFPNQWKNDEEKGGKNLFEEDFFRAQLKRLDANNHRRTENLRTFLSNLDPKRYRTDFAIEGSCNYAFTLILREADDRLAQAVMRALSDAGIEFRRGTSGGGNQLRQPYLRNIVGDNAWKACPKVDHVHFYGMYIGNYPDLEKERILELCALLNKVRA